MTAIITTFFFLLTMLVGHEKPCGYKRGKLKTIGAWLLMLLALADMALAVCIALKVEDTYNELDYTLEFFKKYALISILMFGWAVYIFTSGPLRSKKWKRAVKSILYFLSSFMLLGSSGSNPLANIMAMVLTFVLFFAISLIDIHKKQNRQENENGQINGNKQIKDQTILYSQQVSIWRIMGKYAVKICVTLTMACFFIVSSVIFTACDGMLFLAVFYFPWFFTLFVYYTYLLWSKKTVTGEKVLLLPLLQKISLFQHYSAESISKKKELIKTVLPFLLTSIVCPFISLLYCDNKHDYTIPGLLCATAPILLLINLVKAYTIKWLYSQNQPKDK